MRFGSFLQLRDAREGHEDRGVELARLDVQHAGVVVGDGDPLHAVEADPVGFPEVRVLLEDHPVAAPPFLDREGAGRDRVLGIGFLTHALHPGLGDNRGAGHGEGGKERGRWGLERDDQRAVVGGFRGIDDAVAVGPERAFVVADAQEREGRVRRGDRRAVRELGVAHGEGIGQSVVRDFPALGQARFEHGAGLVDADQHVIDIGEHPEVDVLRRHDRIEGGAVLAAADRQDAGGFGVACGEGQAGGEGQRADADPSVGHGFVSLVGGQIRPLRPAAVCPGRYRE